ncbi:hypothetical protein RDWZM_008495 [Blomia tropicalis]|uniref:Protein kinase domain-containing protein n=1 Tax=Blomia tropicalis TaxID=40697 RepID=A0A9Q0LZH2_BLOTA|nr:hypothetical protein RDWZM_008495 [Blomia tropicalis]
MAFNLRNLLGLRDRRERSIEDIMVDRDDYVMPRDPTDFFNHHGYQALVRNQLKLSDVVYHRSFQFGHYFVGKKYDAPLVPRWACEADGVERKNYNMKVFEHNENNSIWENYEYKAKAEIYIRQKLKHENISKYYGTIALSDNHIHRGCYILKLEFTQCNLQSVIDVMHYTVPQSRRLLRQIGGAIQYLHEKKIAHLAITTMTIRIKELDRSNYEEELNHNVIYKLSDFAYARKYKVPYGVAEERELPEFLDDTNYNAPETVGLSYNPFKADMFSLGGVILTSLVGQQTAFRLMNQYSMLAAKDLFRQEVFDFRTMTFTFSSLNNNVDERLDSRHLATFY